MQIEATWWSRKSVVIPAAVLLATMGLACSGNSNDTGSATSGTVAADEPGGTADKKTLFYAFGTTVKFKDGSTLAVGRPQKFTRTNYHSGGENFKTHLKFKATFKNNTQEVFDPALTTGAVSGGGLEGDSVYGPGLDAPDNKVLPGKSVTWYMGYGVQSEKDLQMEVSVGFLDYGTVIFTN